MARTDYELTVDDFGDLVLTTRTRLGPVHDVHDTDLPQEVWDDLEAIRRDDADAQRFSAGCRAAADAAYTRAIGGVR